MDMRRPLWEVHLIEGLQGGRIALYSKLHHSLADGVSGIGLLNFSEDPKRSRTPPVWAQARERKPRSVATRSGPRGFLPAALVSQARALPNLLRGLAGSASAALGMKSDPDFTSLAESPRTIFNTHITPQRRLATQTASLERMKAIGDAAGGTVNDVLLAACGGALRRYLAGIGKLPRKSLVAGVPVALPRDASQAGGNAISSVNVRLGTDTEDVRERFEIIRRSSAAGRAYLKQMSSTALIDYTMLISSPQILAQLPGIGPLVPTTYNLTISNVPGPRAKLYFLGAEMDALFPITALVHGQALIITMVSYAGGVYFGFTACPDQVPSVQRLAVYTGEALDELEAVILGVRKRKRRGPKAPAARSARRAPRARPK
jgi:WS/DGAT/MGAT family acyltransferase